MTFAKGHALLIGVGNYKDPAVPDVPITVKDAEAVAAILRDPDACGYPAAQVKLIHDEQATKAGILTALDELSKVGKDDTVFLFYCGHGDFGTDGEYYLVSSDAGVRNRKVAAGTGVSHAELLDKLHKIPAERVIMIVNACHSGSVSPENLGAGGDTLKGTNPPEETAGALLGTGKGRILITACRGDQVSWIGNGDLSIFTQAVVDGLRGRAPNRGGYISAFGLYEQVYTAVGKAVHDAKYPVQEPELTVVKGVGPFPVALYRGASDLGTFDDGETVPPDTAVRQVSAEDSKRYYNQIITTNQSGGVNIGGQANVNTGGGSIVGGNMFNAQGAQGAVLNPQGPVNQQFGNRIDTGGGMYVGGNVTNSGQLAGRDLTNIQNSGGASTEEFNKLLAELTHALADAHLDADELQAVEDDLARIKDQLNKPEPKPALVTGRLESIKRVIEGAAGVATAATPLVPIIERGIALAQQLFK